MATGAETFLGEHKVKKKMVSKKMGEVREKNGCTCRDHIEDAKAKEINGAVIHHR
jgi:hypothetical protein